MDYWQLCGTVASVAFTVGFVGQLRTTYQTRNVEGLSLLQWLVFTMASSMFAAYYVHLEQWMMVSVSIFGAVVCLLIVLMVLKYRRSEVLF
ncbi:SemiSWEET family sugar transporter [Ghiorsea bivora]|uniref:SemiSWEET family sugar transporter n=1 Tax=Ghiorsea bivora TaxID=1485545 RepID=UPI00056FA5FA|nr:PQ-loop domain-containing transporter [Ghiorsea bivora]